MAKPGARLRAIGEHIGDWLTAGRGSRAPGRGAGRSGARDRADLRGRRGPAHLGHRLALGAARARAAAVPRPGRSLSLICERHLLGRHGVLSGGRLLPPPAGASDLWHTYLAGFHPVGVGSTADAAPYLPVLALISAVLLGKVWLAVDVLLLGCVPLAGLAAYRATRGYLHSRAVRAYAGATYALLPVGIESVTGGRLGVAVAFVLLPLLVRALARCFIGATHRAAGASPGLLGCCWRWPVAFAPDLLPAADLAVLARGGALRGPPAGPRRTVRARTR